MNRAIIVQPIMWNVFSMKALKSINALVKEMSV